jgi:beta-glucuronidase
MHRRFRVHDIRRVTDLAGYWDFAFLGDIEPGEIDPGEIVYDDIAAVPGSFDVSPRYAGQRGLCAYRTTAPVRGGGHGRLVLDGVHHWSRTFIAGEAVGDHVGGFTRFACDAAELPVGEVEIVVLVDNRLDFDRCPTHLAHYDWYHFGGIARGAEWHDLGGHWINELRLNVLDLAERKVELFVDYTAMDRPGSYPLEVTWNGQEVLSDRLTLDNKFGRFRRELTLPGARLWSPDEPNLHHLHVRFGDDDMRDRIGLRTVETRGRSILLNGQPLRLLGFCRHESHPQFGHGLPAQLILSDAHRLKEMGCNFVRGSHYPQDLRFLDLCDELGLCVWNEGTGWGNNAEQLTSPAFRKVAADNVREMVAAAGNRPSVILWGVLNEAHTDHPDSRPIFEELLGLLGELDPTRPVTYATCRPGGDVNLDLADVISINCYPGWYGGGIETIGEQLDGLVKMMAEKGQGDKPLIVSEIGGGALYGWRDEHDPKWSEGYQASLLAETIRHMFERSDAFAGLSIWQFCDMRTERNYELGRPRGFNNKGVLDEYRRPKQGAGVVADLFRRLGG